MPQAVGAADAGQRRQLHALHAVPAGGGGGDAGAAPRGDAAARHPQAHLPAARLDRRPRPRGARRSSCGPRRRGRAASLRPAAARARLGLAGRCRCPASPSTRSASRASPTRSGCATTWSRRSRRPTRPRTRPAATSCSPTSSSAAATPASRRWPSCRTSPPTRWRATRAPACTGCAGSWSRRPTGSCRRSTPSSPTTRCASCAAAASTSASSTTLEEVGRRQRPPLHRRDAADPHRRLDRRRRPAPEPARAQPAARRARPGPGRRPPAGRGHGLGLGDRRLRRGPRPARRHLPADRPARGPPGPGRGPQHRRRARASARRAPFEYRGNASFVNLGRYKAVGRVGGRTFRGFPAWWMARTYHMSQIPGAARKARAVIDWTAEPALPPRHLRGRLDRPPEARWSATMGPWASSTSSSPSSSASPPAIIGRGKGSSFWIWFLIGTVLPLLGLIAVILYRGREGRTRTPVPELPQGAQALRPGLPALRHRPLPARPGGGPPPGRQVALRASRPPARGPYSTAARCGRSRWRSRRRSGRPPASSSGRAGAARP